MTKFYVDKNAVKNGYALNESGQYPTDSTNCLETELASQSASLSKNILFVPITKSILIYK
jgi:hypothetical protein